MIQPIRNEVLVKPFLTESVTSGGLIIPDSCRKHSSRVEIISVGNGTEKEPMRLKKGQIGYRVKDWGTPIEENGELYFIMEQKAIIAIEN